MAATTIKTSTVYDSYFWVKWESGGQDVSANKTAINWSCGVTPGHKFYSNAVKMSAVSIGGVTVYAGGTYSNITDYPVGSIYLSVSGTDPQTLFGGTWARLEDVFLLAAGAKHAAGSTGGEESHTLTEDEIAPHKHAMAYGPESSASSTGFPYGIAAGSATNSAGGRGYASNLGTFSAGGGQPHNNMPPYLAVYTWKRTA